MELMKEINALADDYTPPVVEDIRTERMLKSMTPPKTEKVDDDKKPEKSKTLSIKNIFHSKK